MADGGFRASWSIRFVSSLEMASPKCRSRLRMERKFRLFRKHVPFLYRIGAAGPEREAGDGTPLRSAICSLAPASSERHPRFHMHFTPTSGSGSLRTLSD